MPFLLKARVLPRGETSYLEKHSVTLGECIEMQRGETKNKSVQPNPSAGVQALGWSERKIF